MKILVKYYVCNYCVIVVEKYLKIYLFGFGIWIFEKWVFGDFII